MRRFLCFPRRRRAGPCKSVTFSEDSERAESPAFVDDEDPFDDLGFGRLALRDTPPVSPDPVTVPFRNTELWCVEPTARKRLPPPETPCRVPKAPLDETITAPAARPRGKNKDAEKRKNPGAGLLPAEKKARTEPSAYSEPTLESESE